MGLTLIIVNLCALAIAVAVTPSVGRLAVRVESKRSRRRSGPSRLGGIAVAVAFLIPLGSALAVGVPGVELSALQLLALCVTTLAVVALGLYDDLFDASALEKLAIQLVLAATTWAIGVRIDGFGATRGYIPLSDLSSFVATVVWIVAVINAVNLIDGLDGLATGIGLIAVSTLFSFGWVDGHVLLCLATATLAGALTGFLVHNTAPARIFLGDSGSHLLGYVLAVVSVLSTAKQYTAWALMLPALALGVPLLDTTLAIVRRWRRGQPLTTPDLDHMHHRLLRRGYSQRQSVFLLYGIGLGLAAAAWAIKADSAPAQALAIAAAACVVFVAVRFIVQHDGASDPSTERLEPHAARDLARRRALTRAVRHAEDLDELWEALLRALIAQGAVTVSLELYTRSPMQRDYGSERRSVRRRRLSLPLYSEKHGYGELEVEQRRTSDPVLDIQREVQIRLLAEAAVDALESMTPVLQSELVVSRLPV